MLFISENGTPKSIAFSTSHQLSQTAASTEISCKDAGIYGMNVVNKLNWEITSENLYSEGGFSQLNTIMQAMQPVVCYFGQATKTDTTRKNGIDSPTAYWSPASASSYVLTYGQGLITSLSVNAASGDNSTMSVTISGNGPLYYNR